ncbi:DUF4148 domain-containing protein [Castellaniella sp. MT123]|uniref:DUF4148 domain-containing protein n=1 Tax=Castellaniella sp. MT123 TaxID=3140381 RepID=UPI0031F3E7CA
MKVASALTALTLGLASVGLAQAAGTSPAQMPSQAGHDPYYPTLQTQSTETHAQIQQELHQAQAQGLVTNGHDPYYPKEGAVSTQTRSQVVHQLQQAGGLSNNSGHNPYYPTNPAA